MVKSVIYEFKEVPFPHFVCGSVEGETKEESHWVAIKEQRESSILFIEISLLDNEIFHILCG